MKQHRFAYHAVLVAIILLNACRPPQKGPIPFDPQKAALHTIPIDEAAGLTRNFRATRTRLAAIVAKSGDSLNRILRLPSAESFNRDAIAVLLNQKDAQGIRIYYGTDAAGVARLVLVPIDSRGNDIITRLVDNGKDRVAAIPGIATATAGAQDGAQAMEKGQQCDPPPCNASKLSR